MSDGIELTIEGKVARIVLAKPDRRNAIDTAMLARFEDVIQELGRQRGLEIALLTGLGPTFCAGTDLKELDKIDAADTAHWQRRTAELVERWYRLELTTITVFNGPAIGSGAVLGLASDLRIAADSTFFSFPEVAYGLPLTWSGVPLLTSLLGADRTKRILLLREKLDAEEIRRLDLVLRTYPTTELEAAGLRLVDSLLETPLLARLMAKRQTRAASAINFAAAINDHYLAALSVATRGGEFKL